MGSPKSEENYPLLLLLLEDGTGSEKKKQSIFFDKNRYNRITEGAGNIYTQLSGQISTCWYGVFFVGVFFFFFLMVFLTSIHPTPYASSCLRYESNKSRDQIYLVDINDNLGRRELEGIEEIIRNYPGVKIELILLSNATEERRASSRRAAVKVLKKVTKQNVTLPSLLKKYRFITVKNTSMASFFAFSPLYSNWRNLNPDLAEFAARVLMLWENGGISFKLPKTFNDVVITDDKTHEKIQVLGMLFEEDWRIDSFIKSNLTTYQRLPPSVVNIDDEGLHMETKTPCHAYFGEVLANLRGADWSTTPTSVVVNALKTFCVTGALSDDFCYNVMMH